MLAYYVAIGLVLFQSLYILFSSNAPDSCTPRDKGLGTQVLNSVSVLVQLCIKNDVDPCSRIIHVQITARQTIN